MSSPTERSYQQTVTMVFDTHLVLLYMLLDTLEVIPIVLTGGQGKPLLDPQLSSKHSQDITLFKKADAIKKEIELFKYSTLI